MSSAPVIHVAIDSWVVLGLTIGIMIPVVIASLGAGYILGHFIVGRFNRTVLGIHIRHWLTRYSPSKFFDYDFIPDRDKP